MTSITYNYIDHHHHHQRHRRHHHHDSDDSHSPEALVALNTEVCDRRFASGKGAP